MYLNIPFFYVVPVVLLMPNVVRVAAESAVCCVRLPVPSRYSAGVYELRWRLIKVLIQVL